MISIIVPVYKVEPYLRQCVDSILNQTYRNIEVLLIDDGSPDRCGEICDEYGAKDDRVRVFHTENRGLSAARNLGISEAKGEYIGFVDSDDWIEPDMYEVLLKQLETTGADIGVCGFWFEHGTSRKEANSGECIYNGKESLEALIDGLINNYVWNKLYRKKTLHSIVFPQGKNYEDIATMYKIIRWSHKTVLLSASEYHYRFRIDSITNMHTAKNVIDFVEAHLDRFLWFESREPEMFGRREALFLKHLAIGIARVWRWWYGCEKEQKEMYSDKIKKLEMFSRNHFPLLGHRTWPRYLRLTTVFMHSKSKLSFAIAFYINQAYRVISKQNV